MIERRQALPEILHRDADLLVVAKPAGLPTTSPDPHRPCLVRWVGEHIFEGRAPHATSRLDSPVSGIVTFALTARANAHLLAARRAGTYGRRYLGITIAATPFTETTWDWPISIHPTDRKLRAAGPGVGARDAMTYCTVEARGAAATLLRLAPVTGRTHQLRVHASKAGVPLFGDHAYGGPRRFVLPSGRVVTASRVMLHCAEVSFPSIEGGAPVTLRAPVPTDMAEAWLGLGGPTEAMTLAS